MNEQTRDFAVLGKPARTGKPGLSTTYHVELSHLAAAVRRIGTMSDAERRRRGQVSRARWEQNRVGFMRTVESMAKMIEQRIGGATGIFERAGFAEARYKPIPSMKPSARLRVLMIGHQREFMMRHRTFSFLPLLLLTTFALAQTEPASEPASQPATQATLSPEARSLLDQVSQAYSDAKALTLTGKISLDFDAGGDQKHESTDFTASYAAPNQFRHEVKDDVLIVSTGKKVYGYLPAKNEYVVVDAPEGKMALKDFSPAVAQLLGSQDPVLLMAILSDPMQVLLTGASNIAKADDVKLGDSSFSAITFEKNDRGYRVLIDPSTHFVRQIRVDRKAEVQKRGVEDVKTVDVTFDYLTTKTQTPAPEQFAWAPPKDATVAKEETDPENLTAALSLEGKPAPDFALTSIDGSSVSLASLKGHVVVLDFWATWCGPCVESLPHLDRMNQELAEKGLKLFAVNQEEPKTQVQKFIVSNKLTLPVLLDSDGAAGQKYLVNAIPETVVIGKDGVIKKVFIGIQDGPEAVRAVVDAEMKK